MKVYLQYEPDLAGMGLWILVERDGQKQVAMPLDLKFTVLKVGDRPKPTLEFDGGEGKEFLQSLAESLVLAGFKPDELKAKNNEVTAIKYHLEDMRKLVFEKVKKEEVR